MGMSKAKCQPDCTLKKRIRSYDMNIHLTYVPRNPDVEICPKCECVLEAEDSNSAAKRKLYMWKTFLFKIERRRRDTKGT